jgi:hypothetical protein
MHRDNTRYLNAEEDEPSLRMHSSVRGGEGYCITRQAA